LERLRKSKPWQRAAIAIASFVASLLVLALFTEDLTFAATFMISAALHELAHASVLRRYGRKSGIVFLGFIAYTYHTEERYKGNATEAVWTLAAGPICNCILGLVCLGLGTRWLLGAQINFWLALLNLAPGMGTDGEKVVKIIRYYSFRGGSRVALLLVLAAEVVGVAGTVLMSTIGKLPGLLYWWTLLFFSMDLILFAAMLRERLKIGAGLSPVPEGLTQTETRKHAFIYLGLIVTTLLGILFLPPTEVITQPWLH